MKTNLTIFLCAMLAICSASVANENTAANAEIYLGQKPPGLIPERFAHDMIDRGFRAASTSFSPDLKEFYFRRRGGEFEKNTLFVIQFKEGKWRESALPPRAGQPFVSPDGNILHLGNKYRERTSIGWSEVKSLAAPIGDMPIMRLTASAKGTYVFDEPTERGHIRYSQVVDGKRQAPQSVSEPINSGMWTAHPFIAADESYIIWDSERDDGYGDSDLYVSFKQSDGSWGKAINLGDKINSKFSDQFGSVTPDGKYFFFHRTYTTDGNKAEIFWVDAKVIENLRPQT